MPDSRPNRAPLRISPAPFKSSLLSIPPSPFSPRTPLTPVARLRKPSSTSSSSSYTNSYSSSPPHIGTAAYKLAPPANPLSWQWTCHQCAHSYPLSATQRCLDDGHRFCSGTTTVKAWRKPNGARRVKKHRACASEFDYSGWKIWLRWRRNIREEDVARRSSTSQKSKVAGRKDCWNNCSYPSECRWGKKYGVHTPIESVVPSTNFAEISTAYSSTSSVQEEDADPMSTLDRSMDIILTPTPLIPSKPTTPSRTSKDTKLWTSLFASAERRKTGTTHIASPLSVVIEEVSPPSSPPSPPPRRWEARKDRDGDTIMSMNSLNIDPRLLTPALNITPKSFMRSTSTFSSLSASTSPPSQSRISPTMLRALWTRKAKTAASPLRYPRRSSTVKGKIGGRSSCAVTMPESSHARKMGIGKRELAMEEGMFEPEEFGVPLETVESRDSGYGSCV